MDCDNIPTSVFVHYHFPITLDFLARFGVNLDSFDINSFLQVVDSSTIPCVIDFKAMIGQK